MPSLARTTRALVACSCVLGLAAGQPESGRVLRKDTTAAEDEISSLPGWDQKLPSKHYSGYITVGAKKDRHMHYYFQESEHAPASDPVTLWMNGGPGCTSLKGGFEELGQLVFNRDSMARNGTPTLSYNPYGWTTVSNLLMFESPPGVGFSYCDECVGNSTCKCEADDLSTASDNYDAVVGFLAKFPALKPNPFYITGESYAGMYIPTLMRNMRDKGGVNLIGAAVGNGVGGKDNSTGGDGGRIRALFYYGKGLYSNLLRDTIIKECGSLYYPTEPTWISQSAACSAALKDMNAEVGPHNFYNLADFCPTEEGGATLDEWVASMETLPDGSMPRMDELLHTKPTCGTPNKDLEPTAAPQGSCATVQPGADSPLGAIEMWCGVDRSMMTWLGDPSVIAALHMKGPKGTEQNNLRYTGGYLGGDLRALYKELALKYRLWIYNGQEDGCIPYTGVEEWTSHLGFPVNASWHPWFGGDGAGGQRVAAGYATWYGGEAKDFGFVTVKGAGHEVPTFKPQAAYTLFTSFLKGDHF